MFKTEGITHHPKEAGNKPNQIVAKEATIVKFPEDLTKKTYYMDAFNKTSASKLLTDRKPSTYVCYPDEESDYIGFSYVTDDGDVKHLKTFKITNMIMIYDKVSHDFSPINAWTNQKEEGVKIEKATVLTLPENVQELEYYFDMDQDAAKKWLSGHKPGSFICHPGKNPTADIGFSYVNANGDIEHSNTSLNVPHIKIAGQDVKIFEPLTPKQKNNAIMKYLNENFNLTKEGGDVPYRKYLYGFSEPHKDELEVLKKEFPDGNQSYEDYCLMFTYYHKNRGHFEYLLDLNRARCREFNEHAKICGTEGKFIEAKSGSKKFAIYLLAIDFGDLKRLMKYGHFNMFLVDPSAKASQQKVIKDNNAPKMRM